MLENPLVIIIIVLAYLFFMYREFKAAKQQMQEQNLRESLTTPAQQKLKNDHEDAQYKLFVYLSFISLILVYFLRRNWLGFMICSASVMINGKIVMLIIIERWSKKQPYSKIIFFASIILLLMSVALISVYFFDQAQFYYQDEYNILQ